MFLLNWAPASAGHRRRQDLGHPALPLRRSATDLSGRRLRLRRDPAVPRAQHRGMVGDGGAAAEPGTGFNRKIWLEFWLEKRIQIPFFILRQVFTTPSYVFLV